jgi:ABC-type glutathione transport system ATPase component
MPEPLLQVRDLRVRRASTILAGVSFDLQAGSITGLFGESGCGKTTLALALLNLLADACRVEGSVRLRGRELTGLGERAMRPLRGAAISLIFQDPMLALNPVLRVARQVGEVLRAHRVPGRVEALLELAGLEPSPRILRAYPHQLSGGERQRVLIAQALACRPSLVIADEPFTALDASRVVELAGLFQKLKQETGIAFLVIGHSLGVLARIADSVLVLHQGRIVEHGPPGRVFRHPEHPYTAAVVAAARSVLVVGAGRARPAPEADQDRGAPDA